MTSYYRLYRVKSGWRWNVKANGRVIGASSEAYVRRGAALDNLNRVTANAFVLFPRQRGREFQWRAER